MDLPGLSGWAYVGGTAVLTIFGLAIKLLKDWVEDRRLGATAKTLSSMVQIYDVLNTLAGTTDCDRALILYTSNGGGVPTTQTPVYCTALYEHTHSAIPLLRSSLQQVPLDAGLVRILHRMLGEGAYHALVDEVPSSWWKNLLESDGAHTFRLLDLGRTPERCYFLCLQWAEPPILEPRLEMDVQTAQLRLRKLLSTR